jgi:hypothetical protein
VKRIVYWLAVLVGFAFVGVAIPSSVSAATPPPAGAIPTTEGASVTVQCQAGQQIASATATYFAKNGKALDVYIQPTYTVNDFGEPITATFVSPKKAEFVLTLVTCSPASVRLTGTIQQVSLYGQTITVATCPQGTVVDRSASTIVAQGNVIPLALAPYLLAGILLIDIENDQTVIATNVSQYVNFDLTLQYDILCMPVS